MKEAVFGNHFIKGSNLDFVTDSAFSFVMQQFLHFYSNQKARNVITTIHGLKGQNKFWKFVSYYLICRS